MIKKVYLVEKGRKEAIDLEKLKRVLSDTPTTVRYICEDKLSGHLSPTETQIRFYEDGWWLIVHHDEDKWYIWDENDLIYEDLSTSELYSVLDDVYSGRIFNCLPSQLASYIHEVKN